MNDLTLAYEHAYTSVMEKFSFLADQPDKYFAYVNLKERKVTTWTGETLGTITEVGAPYRDNFGGTRRTIDVRTVDGNARYSGTYYESAGDYARLRKVKPVKLTPVTRIPAYAVIIRAIWERGTTQAEAKAELRRRGLWLTDEQEAQSRQ